MVGGGLCSLLPYGSDICHLCIYIMFFLSFFFFFFHAVHSFLLFFLILVCKNWNGQQCQHVLVCMLFLVLCFETRVVLIIEETNSIKVCVECLCMYILNWIFVDSVDLI